MPTRATCMDYVVSLRSCSSRPVNHKTTVKRAKYYILTHSKPLAGYNVHIDLNLFSCSPFNKTKNYNVSLIDDNLDIIGLL